MSTFFGSIPSKNLMPRGTKWYLDSAARRFGGAKRDWDSDCALRLVVTKETRPNDQVLSLGSTAGCKENSLSFFGLQRGSGGSSLTPAAPTEPSGRAEQHDPEQKDRAVLGEEQNQRD